MSTPSFDQAIHRLPQSILDKLQALISRVRRLLLIRGIFAVLAVALISVLLIMAIDASVTLFSSMARWTLSLAGLAATLVAVWWYLIRPLSNKLTLTQVARYLEIQHPELQERISTAVELMSSDDPDSVRGSEELINAVVDSAVIDVEKVDPQTEFKPVKANRFVKAAAIAFALLLGLFVIWPQQIGILLSRAVAPFLDIGNAWAETLQVEPGDLRIAVGEDVRITMTVDQKRLRRAELRRVLPNGEGESVERMTLLGEDEEGRKRFEITFPSVGESFAYRVTAGSAVSEFYDITAVSRPIVESISIRYDYPAYTQRDPEEQTRESGEIRALVNTEVTVTATLNKPVTEAVFTINEGQRLPSPDEVSEGGESSVLTWKFPLERRMNGTWALTVADTDGFENQAEEFPIAALPDRAPVVKIETPVARELRLNPTELLPIQYTVQEDYGFTEMAILATINGEQLPQVRLQATPEQAVAGLPESWQGTATLNLASLDLKDKKRITVQLRASDNLPEALDGAQQGLSDTLTILIDRNAKSLTQQTIEEQRKTLEKAIREARSELERAKNETREAERDLAQKDKLSEAQKDLQEFQEDAGNAQEKLREAADALANSVFNQQAEKLESVAEQEVSDARERAEMIPVLDEQKDRVAEVREARKDIEEAIKNLSEIERSINETAQEAKMLAQLNDLANDQRELAQKAEQQAQQADPSADEKRQQQELAKWQREQENVQKDLGKMLQENQEAFAEVLEKQQARAEALAEQTEALAQEQEATKQMTEQASKAEQQEALKDALLAAIREDQKQVAEETQAMQTAAATTESQPKPGSEASAEGDEVAAETETESTEQASTNSEEGSEAAAKDVAASENVATESAKAAQQEALAEASAQTQKAAEQTQSAAENESSESLNSAVEAATEAKNALVEATTQAEATAKAKAAQSESQQQAAMAEAQAAGTDPSEAMAQSSASAEADDADADAATSAELAQRQEAIAEQLAAVAAGDLDAALEIREAQIQEQASQLQVATEALEQATETAQAWNAKGQADQAENALKQATQQASQAGQDLAEAQQAQAQAEEKGQAEAGQPSQQAQQQLQQSQQRQQQAAQSMQQAANALKQSAQSLAQQAQQAGQQAAQQAQQAAEKGEPGPPMDSEQLADSFEEVSEAADAQSAQEASQQAQQAAESLQQLAQQAMQQMGMGGQPGQGSESPGQEGQPSEEIKDIAEGSPQLNEGGKSVAQLNGDGIPPELEALGISAADWAKLRGALSSGSTTGGPDDVSPEYRELVGRYFRVIAGEAK